MSCQSLRDDQRHFEFSLRLVLCDQLLQHVMNLMPSRISSIQKNMMNEQRELPEMETAQLYPSRILGVCALTT